MCHNYCLSSWWEFEFYTKVIPSCVICRMFSLNLFLLFFLCRSDPHPVTGGGHQVPLFFPDFNNSAQRGGLPCSVPWPHNPPDKTDSQHSHHDVHLWVGSVPSEWLAPPPLFTVYVTLTLFGNRGTRLRTTAPRPTQQPAYRKRTRKTRWALAQWHERWR